MPRDGTKNLINQSMRTKEEQKEIAVKGGIASGVARREKAAERIRLKSIAEIVVDKNLLPPALKNMDGIVDQQTFIDFMIIKKAREGNYKYTELFYKIIGDDPTIKLKEREVVVKEKELANSEASRVTETPLIFEVFDEIEEYYRQAIGILDGEGPTA